MRKGENGGNSVRIGEGMVKKNGKDLMSGMERVYTEDMQVCDRKDISRSGMK